MLSLFRLAINKNILENSYTNLVKTGSYIKQDDAYIEQFNYPRTAYNVYHLLKDI